MSRVRWLPYVYGSMQGWRTEHIWGNRDALWPDGGTLGMRYQVAWTEVPVYDPRGQVIGWFLFSPTEPVIPADEEASA